MYACGVSASLLAALTMANMSPQGKKFDGLVTKVDAAWETEDRPDVQAEALLEHVLEMLVVLKSDTVKRKLFAAESAQLSTPMKRASLNRGLSALEMSCVRAAGDGNSHVVMETAMDYAAGEGAKMNVADVMKKAQMHSDEGKKSADVPWYAIPDKAVFVLLMAGKSLAELQSRATPGKWHVFVDLTECRPMCISTASLFGKQAGPGEDSSTWGEPDMVNCMRSILNAKAEKPLFFQSSSQFWACWERFMVAVQAVEMMDLRMIRCYRYFLLQLQEEWRLEGRPPMFLWLYDQVLRKELRST